MQLYLFNQPGGVMKKTHVLLILSIFILFNLSFAQGEKGVLFGINVANLHGDDVSDQADARTAYAIGFYSTIPMNDMLSIRPELFYSMKGSSSKSSYDDNGYKETMESTIKLNYVEVPVLAVINLASLIEVFGGAYVAYYLNGETETKWTTEYNGVKDSGTNTHKIKSDDIESLDYGIVAGAAVRLGMFRVGARYSVGMATLDKDGEADVKNGMIQLLGGIIF